MDSAEPGEGGAVPAGRWASCCHREIRIGSDREKEEEKEGRRRRRKKERKACVTVLQRKQGKRRGREKQRWRGGARGSSEGAGGE